MSVDQSTVTYRPVPGYPHYRVGDDGSVWVDHMLRTNGRPSGWKRLRGEPYNGGYIRVRLSPSRERRPVHQLVLEAFVGPCPDGMICRHHPDPTPSNNALTNLQWGTYAENRADEIAQGRPRKKLYHAAKLTEAVVQEIRTRYRNGENATELAEAFKLNTAQTVHNLVYRKTWRHVPDDHEPLRPKTRLTREQIAEIRRRAPTSSAIALAAEYGVTASHMRLIIRGKVCK